MADPTGLRGALQAMALGWGMESPLQTAQIFSSWTEIVGADVAAKCKPTSLKGGVLKVRTDSPAWASEFRYLAAEIAGRINAALGAEVVCEIKPWVGPAVKENKARAAGPKTSRDGIRAELKPSVVAEGKALAGQVPDHKVAGALEKAFLASKNR